MVVKLAAHAVGYHPSIPIIQPPQHYSTSPTYCGGLHSGDYLLWQIQGVHIPAAGERAMHLQRCGQPLLQSHVDVWLPGYRLWLPTLTHTADQQEGACTRESMRSTWAVWYAQHACTGRPGNAFSWLTLLPAPSSDGRGNGTACCLPEEVCHSQVAQLPAP